MPASTQRVRAVRAVGLRTHGQDGAQQVTGIVGREGEAAEAHADGEDGRPCDGRAQPCRRVHGAISPTCASKY
ncbi:hypothetical protein [Janthinobacterium sp. MDT1-19]|uniref:hypothetical protein n=1 Tax=Janthinobacterium sp. MDT1-19 TaxID=1259339 RepID=UPI003F2166E3